MRNVFLLGAGFSRAVSVEMPLTDQLAENDAIKSFRGRALVRSTGVESILTLLSESQPWLTEDENLRNRADFIQFAQTVNHTIRNYQMSAIRDTGSPPDWLTSLVLKWSQDEETIITFNYDTLVEKAITHSFKQDYQQVPSSDLAWAHSAAYEVPIPRITTRSGLDGLSKSLAPPERLPRLIKLHGSLNWYYSGSEPSFGEVIYDIGIRPFWESSADDRKIGDMSRFSAGKVPLIIPPTSGKSSFFTNETVRGQWTSARRALEEADRIVIIGYSLPPGDHMVRFLLEYACAPRAGKPSKAVVAVNPDAIVSRMLQKLLGCDVKPYLTVEDFTADYVNIA